MPARLFRRIQSIFCRLNKTLLLSIAVFLLGVLFIGTPIVKAQNAPALTDKYSAWTNLFNGTSITNIALQQSTSNNNGNGVVITMNITLNPAGGESIKKAWDRTHINATNASAQTFVSKMCDGQNNCWLGILPADTNNDSGGNIAEKDNSGNYTDQENNLSVSAFSSTAGQNVSFTTGTSYGATTTDLTQGGEIYRYNADGSVSPIANVVMPQGSTLNFTLWYCADGLGANAAADYAKAGISNPSIATFGTLCGGNTYFEMTASPFSFIVPTTAAGVQQSVQQGQQALSKPATVTSSEDSNLPACGIIWGSNGTINGCLAQVAYGIYELCAWVAGLFGQLFDFFMGYSLSDASYRYTFAVTGWQLVRDISNIFFILIMVWTGFAAVFNTEKASYKSIVPNLIINAVLINFSLFFTRIVIDVSNVTARVFYSQMVVCQEAAIKANGGTCTPAQADRTGPGGYWKLSAKIVSSFDPEKMFAPNILQPPNYDAGNDKNSAAETSKSIHNFSSQQIGSNASVLSPREYAIYFGIISLLAAGIMIMIAIMFFKTSFLFIGRVVGLYLCMIFSPFAFLSRQISFFDKMEKLRWKDWFSELINYALLAPVFIFLLYIIYILLNSNFAAQMATVATNSNSVMEIILSIAIPMAIIYLLITQATKIATGFSGDIGKRIQDLGKTVTGYAGAVGGIALGIATDGASLAATAGARVTSLSAERRTSLEAQKAKGGFGGWVARQQLKASDWTQKQNFNLRNTDLYQNATGKLGIKTNEKALEYIGFGKKRTEGGREGMIKRSKAVTKGKIESIKTSLKDDKVAEFWQEHMGAKLEKIAKDAYFAKKMAEARSPDEKKNIENSKKNGTYTSDTEYTKILEREKAESEKAYGKVTNNKQLTKALRTEYAATILGEKVPGQNPEKDTFKGALLSGAGAKAAMALPIIGTATAAFAGVGALGLAAGNYTEDKGKREAAQEYLDKSVKELKKKPRNERLEDESGELTKKIEDFEEKIKKALVEAVEEREKDPKKAKYGTQSDTAKKESIDKEVADLQSDTKKAKDAIEEFRQSLQTQFDVLNLDVEYINEQHKDVLKKLRDTTDAAERARLENQEKDLKAELIETTARRNAKISYSNSIDPAKKEKLESERTKIDGQIDQIKEKEENKDKGGDKK